MEHTDLKPRIASGIKQKLPSTDGIGKKPDTFYTGNIVTATSRDEIVGSLHRGDERNTFGKGSWGRFEENGTCYVITRPDTPRPWENFLYSKDGRFLVAISQRGKGPVTYIAPDANLVSHGRNYCLLNKQSGVCWSLNAGDAPNKAKYYRCEHRPGRTVFISKNQGIISRLTVAVSPSRHLEINRVELENTTNIAGMFSLIGYYDTDLLGVANDSQLERSRFLADIGAVVVQRCHYATVPYKYAGFYAADRLPSSYCGDMERLFDQDVPRNEAEVWKRGVLPNVDAWSTKLVQALQHDIVLAPGETLTLHYGFGLAENMPEAEILARQFVGERQAEHALKENEHLFDTLVKSCPITTHDEVLDTALNTWTKVQLHRQVVSARGWAKHNWRNNLQDAWGWMVFDPSWAGHYLKELCSLAKEDGFMPRSSFRVPEASSERHEVVQRHVDIAAWAGMVAGRYGAETGDLEFFAQKVKYADGTREATVIECIINGLRWMAAHTGRHGMILLLDGDWSDPLEEAGRRGIGESPWTSVAFIHAVKSLNPVLIALGHGDTAREFQEAAERLSQAVNAHAWDGQWYIRGITDEGVRFCTASDPDANVSLMMQAWAIISGIVPSERMASVLKAVDESVKTENGPILYGPPFLKWRVHLGRETCKQPGTGENGSCYVHAAMMLAMAEIVAGRADEALKMIKQILPMRDPDGTETTRAVPLWCPNFWHGPHSSQPGLTSGIHSTGAPGWLFIDVYEGLLGLRPTLKGLEVKPCLPSTWNQVSFVRQWRGSTYRFEFVRAPGKANVTVELNGRTLDTLIIPVPHESSTYTVKVTIG